MPDDGARGRVFHGIVQKVENCLFQQQGIGADQGKVRRQIDREFMRGQAPGEPLGGRLDKIDDVKGLGLGAQDTGFQTGHVEQISHKAVEALGLLPDGREQFVRLLGVIEIAAGDEGGGGAQNGCQRRAQIMRKRGQHRHPELVGLRQHLGFVHAFHQSGRARSQAPPDRAARPEGVFRPE